MRRLTVRLILAILLPIIALAQGEAGDMRKRVTNQDQASTNCSAVDDATITTNVRERLAKAKSLRDAAIDVTTSDGVVTLTGTVKTSGLKGVASRLAKRVDCVKKVDNQLKFDRALGGSSSKTG